MTDATLTPRITGLCGERLGPANDDHHQYVSFWIEDHWLGVPVSLVQEVLKPQRVTPTPLARPEIAGLFSLRGRIMTAINLRRRLGLPDRTEALSSMHVIVRCPGEPYSLLVDEIGDVINVVGLPSAAWPDHLDGRWKAFSVGVCRSSDRLFVLLDVPALLAFE